MQPYFSILYESARRFAFDASDAEDLVQEVCIKAYAHLDKLEQMEYPRAWLLRVLYHTFIDMRRDSKRSPVNLARSIHEDGESELRETSRLEPDRQVEHQMRIERVLSAMSYLDKESCALLAMHDVNGMDIKELSVLTGMPEGTIKSRLFRTRAKLGRLLQNIQVGRLQLRVLEG